MLIILILLDLVLSFLYSNKHFHKIKDHPLKEILLPPSANTKSFAIHLGVINNDNETPRISQIRSRRGFYRPAAPSLIFSLYFIAALRALVSVIPTWRRCTDSRLARAAFPGVSRDVRMYICLGPGVSSCWTEILVFFLFSRGEVCDSCSAWNVFTRIFCTNAVSSKCSIRRFDGLVGRLFWNDAKKYLCMILVAWWLGFYSKRNEFSFYDDVMEYFFVKASIVSK